MSEISNVNEIIEKIVNKKVKSFNYKVDEWKSWYRGKVDGFHSYRLFNGQNSMEIEKKSLNMAKTVCEDWADALVNEKLDFTIPEADKPKMNNIFTKNNTNVLLNEAVEKSFSTGQGMILVGLKNYAIGKDTGNFQATKYTEVTIDFIDVTCIKVLTVERKRVTECAFVSESTDYTDIAIHVLNEQKNYNIYFVKVSNDTKEIVEQTMIDTKSPIKWFFEIRPNVNNNSFLYDSLGMSIYANSIDVLKAIDDLFDGFSVEYVLLRPRIFVSADTYKIVIDGETGKQVRTIDPYDSVYYLLPKDDDNKNHIQSEVPQIRYDAYINGINTLLNILSKKVGFGTERYKFDKGSIATATQIISENSDFARSIKKHEHIFRQALIDLIWCIKYVNNTFTLQEKFSEFKYEEIKIDFDDSIIEDKEAIRKRDREDVNAGLMSVVEYRMKHYNEDEENAKKSIFGFFLYKEIEKYTQAVKDGLMTPKEFVLKAYGKEDAELEAYITEQLNKANVNPMDLFGEYSNNNNSDDEDGENPNKNEKNIDTNNE